MESRSPPVQVPRIATDRLLLRELRMSDFDEYFERIGELTTKLPLPDRRTAWRMFASSSGLWMLTGAGWWIVEHRETKTLAGTVGAFYREGFPDLEVGWSMVTRFRKQGVATEAAKAAVAWAFTRPDVRRVIAHIDADNTASRRVAEKLGMSSEGETDFYGEKTTRWAVERRRD
jgi:RimJ/RimL family protein N-acetyltransferase